MSRRANTITKALGVTTKWLGATAKRQARIRVTEIKSGNSKLVNWGYELETLENHERAARLFLGEGNLLAVGDFGNGYVFVKGGA